jgi:hypothetical protein
MQAMLMRRLPMACRAEQCDKKARRYQVAAEVLLPRMNVDDTDVADSPDCAEK